MYFSRTTGNFSVPILNHYLKSYTAGIYLAAHVNDGYEPSNKNICKVDIGPSGPGALPLLRERMQSLKSVES